MNVWRRRPRSGKQRLVRRRGASQFVLPVLAAASITAAIVTLGGAPSAAPGVAPQATPGELTVEQVQGRQLYMRDCAWCHGSAGEGSIYGPPIDASGTASVDFMLRTGRMPIEEPRSDPPPMPPAYSAEEIGALVAYASTFVEGPPIPDVDPAAGDLQQGEVLYQENCAACHSSTGIGAALTSGQAAPDLRDSSATEIGEAIRIGGAGILTGDMPRYDERTLSPEQVDALARYITEVLQRPADPGGVPLNHIGPVAEGFIAVFVLLPLLALVIRWIGKTT